MSDNLSDPVIDEDEEYRRRGHGIGEKPPDWPEGKEWPPRGLHPQPAPSPHTDSQLGRHV